MGTFLKKIEGPVWEEKPNGLSFTERRAKAAPRPCPFSCAVPAVIEYSLSTEYDDPYNLQQYG